MSGPESFEMRQMTEDDLPLVLPISDLVHPTFPERMEVLSRKLKIWPPGSQCFMQAGTLVGYAQAVPWEREKVMPVNVEITLPEVPTVIYVHEVTILPEGRRQGFGTLYLQHLHRMAQQIPSVTALALVSVYGTEKKVGLGDVGFVRVPCSQEFLEEVERIYGKEAVYVERSTVDTRGMERVPAFARKQ